MTRRNTPAGVGTDRIIRAVSARRPALPGSRLADDSLLAAPRQPRTAEEREAAERADAVARRSAALQVCGAVVRGGCGGAGCTAPDHVEHVALARGWAEAVLGADGLEALKGAARRGAG